jgi:hypothetical protein
MEILTGGWHVAVSQIMNPIKGEQLLTQLNWRYATKQFDSARKISPEDLGGPGKRVDPFADLCGCGVILFFILVQLGLHRRLDFFVECPIIF